MSGMKYMNSCVNWPQHDVSAEGGIVEHGGPVQECLTQYLLKHVDQTDLHELEACPRLLTLSQAGYDYGGRLPRQLPPVETAW